MDENIPKIHNDAYPAGSQRVSFQGRKGIILAILPFLLILLLDALPKLLVISGLLSWEDKATSWLNTILAILFGATFLLAIFLAWRERWPTWSASWYPFLTVPIVLLAGWLARRVSTTKYAQDLIIYIFLPLAIAFLLYAVTRLYRLRGLLAAIPILYALWWPNMEFVPDPIEVTIKTASTTLICLAIAYLLRVGDWRRGLFAILAANLGVGAMFSFAGIYYGGTLPFSAPGPNLVETLRSLVPQYLATSAILLGPFFAWQFRKIGHTGGKASLVSYHLALVGLLLLILGNLVALMEEMSSSFPIYSDVNYIILTATIAFGVGLYLLGLFFLYRTTQPVSGELGWIQRILLTILPLGIPLILILPFISWKAPVSRLYGVPLLWELPHAVSLSIGLLWLVLAVWVVAMDEKPKEPSEALEPKNLPHNGSWLSGSRQRGETLH